MKRPLPYHLFLIYLLLFTGNLFADQKDSATIKLSGYIDTYYAYYTDSVGPGNYQKFPSVDPRSNSFGLDHAMISAQYDGSKYRGIVTAHYGDIPRSIWSPTFNGIMEAHAGVKIASDLWLDAGFFRTHTGAEGLLPKENFASCISISTFYEPYYESGARLDYHPSAKFTVDFYVLNGYNMYEDNNNKKSVGLYACYAFNDNTNIGYTNYIGDDTPLAADTISHLRIYQNIFANYQIGKLKMQMGFDFFLQQNSNIVEQNKTVSTFSGVLNLKYYFNDRFSIYTRGEIFNDPQGFVSTVFPDSTGLLTGYKLWGNTTGIEYKPTENSYIRLEGRKLQMDSNQYIYYWNGAKRNYRLETLLNLGISF
jgi:hypothetical protein